jgi:drug/metabolite transporter (DMT)-like permease
MKPVVTKFKSLSAGSIEMRRLAPYLIVYAAFLAFCFLSSIRDVLSEIMFKHQSYDASPVFVLFVYSIITQMVAGFFLLAMRAGSSPIVLLPTGVKTREIILLNLFTLAAFFFYFAAIQSPIGAGLNAFIDYGTGPIFTALVGAVLLRQPFTRRFGIAAALSVVGLGVLELRRAYGAEMSSVSLIGTLLALLSSCAGAIYQVYYKVLLDKGMTKSAIIIFRLLATTVVLGAVLLARPDLFRLDLLPQTALIGFFGFSVPLFLTLTVMQRVQIQSFAMLLFLFPVLTLLISARIGTAELYLSDLIAGGLLLVAIIVYEYWNKTS